MVSIKRFLSFFLVLCLLTSVAFSESVFNSIGNWFGQAAEDTANWTTQAWEDTTAWTTQAWDDSSKWVGQAWDDSMKWVAQAWDDSSKWVGQAWQDTSDWAAGNWSNFIIWAKTITSDNPYSWIRDLVLEEGIMAYDDYVVIRSFIAENKESNEIKQKCFELLTELSQLDEDKEKLWEILEKWSNTHKVTVEQTALLCIPFIERLYIKGEEALGENVDFSGPSIAQYLITVLEAMKIESHEDAEARLNALRSGLDNLIRPIVVGDQDQNVLVTEDQYYIENFTYANGKYQIIMLVSSLNENDSETLMVRGKSNEQLIKSYFKNIESWGPVEQYTIANNTALSRRFNILMDEKPACAAEVIVWTEKNAYVFFIVTDQEWKDNEFETWQSSLQLSEEKITFEVDFDSDGAFYGINQAAQKYTIVRYFTESKFTVPRTGHGWAAERGNNLIDNLKGFFKGEHSIVKGDDNVHNGADRVTTSADGSRIFIQTKYYSTAARTINACFDEQGFRYVDADGNPMNIEVPSNQYETAVKLMEKRIQNGEIPNVDPSDVDMAKKIVKKGSLSYQQAKHLAKAGTIESLMYDSAHACVYAASAMGISAVVEFAISLWSGNEMETAIRNSINSGLRTGGITFIVSVLSSQILKTSINSALVPTSDAIVNTLGSKVAARIVNAFRPAGSAIAGAAAKKAASKLLRGNIVSSTITFVVLTSFDVAEIVQGRISWKQLAKNAAGNVAGIAGGTVGYIAGAALVGTSLFPGAGTIAGIIVGAAVGWGASEGAKALTNLIAEDDADEMILIINDQFALIAEEYFLTEVEVNRSIDNLQALLSQNMLKEMYQYGNHEAFARQLIEMSIDPVVMERKYISLPSEEEYAEILTETLNGISEEIGDEQEAQ